MAKPVAYRTYLILVLAGVGLGLGVGILLYKHRSTPTSLAAVSTPEFIVWLGLIGVLMMLFAVLPLPLAKDLQDLRRYFAGNEIDIVVSSLMLTLLISVPLLIARFLWKPIDQYPLPHTLEKIAVIMTIGYITTILPAAVGIWLVRAGLRIEFGKIQPDEKHIQQYLRFRDRLQWFISILGLVIGLATLSTGAARKGLIAWGVSAESYPLTIVLVYGAYYTVLLALVYIPTYSSLVEIGRDLLEVFFPISSPKSDDWTDMYAKRMDLEEVLQLRTSVQHNLQSRVAVLAPLLSGIFATLLQ